MLGAHPLPRSLFTGSALFSRCGLAGAARCVDSSHVFRKTAFRGRTYRPHFYAAFFAVQSLLGDGPALHQLAEFRARFFLVQMVEIPALVVHCGGLLAVYSIEGSKNRACSFTL